MNHLNEKYILRKWVTVFSFILFFSFSFFTTTLYSQNIISRDVADYPGGIVSSDCSTSPYTGCEIVLPAAKVGQSYLFTIPLKSGILRSDISFSFNQITACKEGNINFTSDGNVEMMATGCCIPTTNNFIEFDLNVVSNSDGTSDSQKYYLPVLREPVKVVLVLDMSGSMSLPVPGGTEVRWQVLKNAVELFTHRLEAFKQDNDSIGLTYFSTELTQPGAPIGSGFIVVDTIPTKSSEIVKTDMSSRGPTYLTAMGKGLLDAKEKLDGNTNINARKLVLLFTDGLQNVEPLVNLDGTTLSPGSYTLNDCPCSKLDSIHYYTIGMGDITLIPEVLGHISEWNGGVSLTTTTGADEGEINNFFQDQFVNMLYGNSPQIVSRKIGTLSSNITYSYSINNNISKLYFELNSSDAQNISIKIEKGGEDLTSYATISKGSFYKTVSFSFPSRSAKMISPEGDWNLTLIGNSTKNYTLTCFVDDHFINFKCEHSKTVYTVGDTLNFVAKLSYANKMLSGSNNKVQVALLKPGDDIGDLLAKYDDTKTDSINDVGAGAETKYQHLIQSDQSFYNALLPKSQIIDLDDKGNGVYKGSYENTDLTGVYQIIYMVNGEVQGIGKFERQKHYSAVFKFGQISETSSTIDAAISTPPATTTNNGGSKMATIKVKPKNRYGHYLGPGYLSRIKLSVDPKQGAIKSAKDNLDGSYTFTVVNIPPNIKPNIKIVVMGETLYDGPFPKPKIHFWQYLVLILLFLLLLLRYVNAHTGKTWLMVLVWILIILWVLLMILQKLGIIHF